MGASNERRIRSLRRARRLLYQYRSRPARRDSSRLAGRLSPSPAIPLGRGRCIAGEGSDRKGDRQPSALSIPDLRHPQALGEVENDPQHEGDKRLYSSGTFPDGNFGLHPPVVGDAGPRRLHRPSGCLLPRTHPSRLAGFVGVSIRGSNVSVSSPSVRPTASTQGLHPRGVSRRRIPEKPWPAVVHLLGRLASRGRLGGEASRSPRPPPSSNSGAGVCHQLGEITTHSLPRSHLPGRGDRHPQSDRPPLSRQGSVDHDPGSLPSGTQPGEGTSLAPTSRAHGQSSRHPRGLSPIHEAISEVSPTPLQTGRRFAEIVDPAHAGDPAQPSLVDPGVVRGSGQATTHSSPFRLCDHGCLPHGLGWPLRGRDGGGGVVSTAHSTTYKCAGDACCVQLAPSLPAQAGRSVGSSLHGQHFCSGLYQPTGRHSVDLSRLDCRGALEMVPIHGHHSSCLLHPGRRQPHSRLPLSGALSSLRVVSPPGGVPVSPGPLGPAGDGLVCHVTQSETSGLLLSGEGTRSRLPGCLLPSLGSAQELCLPSVCINSSGLTQSEGGRCVASSGSPQVAQTSLVPSTPGVVGRRASAPSTEVRSSISTSLGVPASAAISPSLDCLAALGEDARDLGLSDRAAHFVAESRRDSTLGLYNSRLGLFSEWCTEHSVEPRTAPVGSVADFLVSMFDKGRSLSTIRGYRSAIAAVHRGFSDGSNVSNSNLLTRLLRSFFLKRPPVKKLAPSWSLPAVLDALSKPPFEPMAKASLLNLTIKTVFLVAIASGQRRSSLHALCITPGHIRWERRGVRLIPTPSFIAKNQTATSGSVEIFLAPISSFSSVTEDKVWCPVRALRWYTNRTKQIRTSDQLFVISREPFSAASRDTLSRWIVDAISAAGEAALLTDARPKAHDTRGIGTSWALFQGVHLDDILRAAFWRSANSFTSFYLKDIPSGEERFASSALKAAAAASVSP